MAGDARLAHAEDFLDLGDGELLPLEKVEEAEACGVCQEAKRFYD
jgi:hypothetical protein